MSKGKGTKKITIKDQSGTVDRLIDELATNGDVLITHLGRFKTIRVQGRKVYNFKKRQMVPVPDFIQVSFTPSKGFRDMLNQKARDG